MKEMRQRMQDLGRRAAQVKEALDSAPARVAQVRDAVAQTRAQVQQLRREVHASVVSLQAGDGDRLASILAEIVGNTETLRLAGYHLAGIEYEIDPVQRVFLLLDKVEAVPVGQLASLQAAHATHPAIHGLLGTLTRAETLGASLSLPDQELWRVRVEVGPAPAVRLCWRPVVEEPASSVPAAPPVLSATPASSSILGEGSFFERRPAGSSSGVAASAVPIEDSKAMSARPPGSAPGPAPASAPVAPGGSILDRFKKMPDLTRRGH
jgi:hypothetical protein